MITQIEVTIFVFLIMFLALSIAIWKDIFDVEQRLKRLEKEVKK